jgi:hypothetical protein
MGIVAVQGKPAEFFVSAGDKFYNPGKILLIYSGFDRIDVRSGYFPENRTHTRVLLKSEMDLFN